MRVRKDKYNKNESNAWALINDQCAPELKNKLEGTVDYITCKNKNDVVSLLSMIRGYCCQFDTLNDEYMSIVGKIWVWAFINAIANLVDVVVSKITCGGRCGSDILLKWCGSILDELTPPSTAMTAPAADCRASTSRKLRLSVYANIFFSNIRSSPSPACRHPRKCRSSSKAGWAHTTCSTTA